MRDPARSQIRNGSDFSSSVCCLRCFYFRYALLRWGCSAWPGRPAARCVLWIALGALCPFGPCCVLGSSGCEDSCTTTTDDPEFGLSQVAGQTRIAASQAQPLGSGACGSCAIHEALNTGPDVWPSAQKSNAAMCVCDQAVPSGGTRASFTRAGSSYSSSPWPLLAPTAGRMRLGPLPSAAYPAARASSGVRPSSDPVYGPA
jgi:hypothetical protein